jgi:hypothetical protein
MGEGDAWLVGAIGKECADAGDGDSKDTARDACGGRYGEEELVVFASVECGAEGLFRWELCCEGMEGDCGGVDFGSEAGGFAEVGEVGGEAVADVDGGGGEVTAKEGGADVEAGLRVSVWVIGCGGSDPRRTVGGEERGEFGVGSAERAGDEEGVAGVCSGAAEGAAGGGGADEDDVGEDEAGGGLGGVAASEGYVVPLGEGAEASEEALDPLLATAGARHVGREGEREEGGDGGGPHGGEVAEAAGEAAMSDRGCGVEVAAEVAVFEGEVGGDEDLVVARRAEDGAVVADAQQNGIAAAGKGAADLLDES